MVYFIRSRDGGPIKIGTTTRLRERLSNLRSEHKSDLHVLGVMAGGREEEGSLHGQWADFRLNGEWFQPAPDLLAFIEVHAKPWDGTDEAEPRPGVLTRVREEVLAECRIAAAFKRLSLFDYLSETLREAAGRDIDEQAEQWRKANS